MKAAVMYRRNDPLQVEEVELSEPGLNEVSVRFAASGVCHSDLHHWRWEMGSPLPLILGHEGAGVVTKTGAGVTRIKPGDHVIIAFGAKCGECFYCLRGEPNLCVPEDGADPIETAYASNRFRGNGNRVFQFQNVSSFSQESIVPANNAVVIPRGVPLECAALVACGVTTGVGAVINTAEVEVGSTVLVIGTGGVGLNVIQGARIAGAARIIAADLLDNKLELAREFGATHAINAGREDVIQRAKELSGGRGVDYAFEVIGLEKTLTQAYESLRKGGTAVLVGVSAPETTMQFSQLAMMRTGRSIIGCFYGSNQHHVDFPKMIDLYRHGKLKLDELISRRFALDEINESFRALEAGEVARGVIVFD